MNLQTSTRLWLAQVILLGTLAACSPYESDPSYPFVFEPVRVLDKGPRGDETYFFVDLDNDDKVEVIRYGTFNRRNGTALKIEQWDGTIIDEIALDGEIASRQLYTYPSQQSEVNDLAIPILRGDSLSLEIIRTDFNKRAVSSHRTFLLTTGQPHILPAKQHSWDPEVIAMYWEDVIGMDREQLITVVRTNHAEVPRGVLLHDFDTGTLLDSLHIGAAIVRTALVETQPDHWKLLFDSYAPDNGVSANGISDSEAIVGAFRLGGKLSITWDRSLAGKNGGSILCSVREWHDGRQVVFAAGHGGRTYLAAPEVNVFDAETGNIVQQFATPLRVYTGFSVRSSTNQQHECWWRLASPGGQYKEEQIVVFNDDGSFNKSFTSDPLSQLVSSQDINDDQNVELTSVTSEAVSLHRAEDFVVVARLSQNKLARSPTVHTLPTEDGTALALEYRHTIHLYRVLPNSWYLLYRYQWWLIAGFSVVLVICLVGLIRLQHYRLRTFRKDLNHQRNQFDREYQALQSEQRKLRQAQQNWLTEALDIHTEKASSGRKPTIGLYELHQALDAVIEKGEYTVSALAQHLRVTPGHTHRLVKDLSGMPPAELIRARRLNATARALKANQVYTLQAIAEQHGFKDYSSFSRAFSQHFGMSPSTFRDQHNLSENSES